MKAGYDVSWSETAEKDFLAIIEYIANDSPSVLMTSSKT